jgi:hypothetical protein
VPAVGDESRQAPRLDLRVVDADPERQPAQARRDPGRRREVGQHAEPALVLRRGGRHDGRIETEPAGHEKSTVLAGRLDDLAHVEAERLGRGEVAGGSFGGAGDAERSTQQVPRAGRDDPEEDAGSLEL